MLGKDEKLQQRWRQESAKEAALERRQRMLADELRNHEVTVERDDGFDISNTTAQMGRPLRVEQVMARLLKCNQRLYFELAKADPSKIGVYLSFPMDSNDGVLYANPQGLLLRLKHLFGMESGLHTDGLMPEFTVIHKTKAKVANQELFGRAEPTRDVPWKEVETYLDQTRG